MAITPTDESNLLLPLFEGIFERPVWETFLRRLAQRTGAQRVRLTVVDSAAPEQMPLRRRVLADRLAQRDDPGEPDPIDARVYAALRPNRASAESKRGLLDVAFVSMQTMHDTIARLKLAAHAPDVTVEIPRNACGYHEFWRADELIALGRERAAQALGGREGAGSAHADEA